MLSFSFAAVPTTSNVETRVNVFADVATELTCAIPRGELADHLDPYTFSWESLNQQGFSIPVPPSPSSQYSNNNRTLTIFVNDSTRDSQYHCVLRLKRCDITRSDGSFRCPVMTYMGDPTRFVVHGKRRIILFTGEIMLLFLCSYLERSRVTTPPNNQAIRMNQVAVFTCVGVGSFINMSWQYDDARISEDAVVIVKDESENGMQITSTLMINASMINTTMLPQSSGMEYTVDIQCILHQRVPPELNLQGRDDLIFSARLEIALDPGGGTTTGKYMCSCKDITYQYHVGLLHKVAITQ